MDQNNKIIRLAESVIEDHDYEILEKIEFVSRLLITRIWVSCGPKDDALLLETAELYFSKKFIDKLTTNLSINGNKFRITMIILQILELFKVNMKEEESKKKLSNLSKSIEIHLDESTKKDWRIRRKLKILFSNYPDDEKYVRDKFLESLGEAENKMSWEANPELKNTMIAAISGLRRASKMNPKVFDAGILGGEFVLGDNLVTKGEEGIWLQSGSKLILGDYGGLYLVFWIKSEKSLNFLKNVYKLDSSYLEYVKSISKEAELIIGKGNEGTLRFALNLVNSESAEIGKLYCIKGREITKGGGDSKSSMENSMAVSIFEGFLTKYISKSLNSPLPIDYGLIYKVKSTNYQVFSLLEFSPNKNMAELLKDKQYRKWEYIRAFFLSFLSDCQHLIDKRYINSDIKPTNIICDISLRKAILIDLGAAFPIHKSFDLENIDISMINLSFNQQFSPPEVKKKELANKHQQISNSKVNIYNCGKTMKNIINICTEGGKIENLQEQNLSEINKLIETMVEDSPEKRPNDLKGLLGLIENSGLNNKITCPISNHYIQRVKQIIKDDKDMAKNEKYYIQQYVAEFNPLKYDNLKTSELLKVLEDFRGDSVHDIFVLFGEAGSGKSIALQQDFNRCVMYYVQNQSELALPIYINLALETDLKKAMECMNLDIFKRKFPLRFKNFVCYLDGFDEAINMKEKINSFLKESINLLEPVVEKVKFIISCRTDFFLEIKEDASVFTRKAGKTIFRYITPIDYEKPINYLESLKKKMSDSKPIKILEEKLSFINDHGLTKFMKTGFLLRILSKIVNTCEIEIKEKRKIFFSKGDIYEIYINNKIISKLNKPGPLSVSKNLKIFFAESKYFHQDQDVLENIKKIGDLIARTMILDNKNKVNYSKLKFSSKQQDESMHYILRHMLPLKIQSSSDKNIEAISFYHETFKNCFLKRCISEEIDINPEEFLKMEPEKILPVLKQAHLSSNYELLRFLSEKYDIEFFKKLEFIVHLSKTNNKYYQDHRWPFELIQKAAANAMTILVAGQHSFAGRDLSFISIPGAKMSGGIFQKTNFKNANLKGTTFSNSLISESEFDEADLSDVILGFYPSLHGHELGVKSIQFNNNGKMLISTGEDGLVKLWDIETGVSVQNTQKINANFNAVCFSGDNKLFAAGGSDKTLYIWETANPSSIKYSFKTDTDHVSSLAFDYKGNKIIAASIDSSIKLWNIQNGEAYTFDGHIGSVWTISYKEKHSLLASGGDDKTIKLWDTQATQLIHTFKEAHGWKIKSIEINDDGSKLVSSCWNSQIKIWSLKNKKLLKTLEGHSLGVSSVRWGKNNITVISGSWDKTIRIWDWQRRQCLKIFEGHKGGISSIDVTYADHNIIIAGSGWNDSIKIWDSSIEECMQQLEGHNWFVTGVRMTKDNSTVISASWDGSVKIWNIKEGKCTKTLKKHKDGIWDLAFSPKFDLAASASEDKKVIIWSLKDEDFKFECELEGHKGGIWGVSFSNNELYVVSGGSDYEVKLWDVKEKKCVHTFKGHERGVASVCFSPDDQNIISGGWDNLIIVWDVKTKNISKKLEGHVNAVWCVLYSKSGILISGSEDSTIKIWDTSNGEVQNSYVDLKGHEKGVWSIDISYNENLLVSGGEDKTIRVWDLIKKCCLHILYGHIGTVRAVCFGWEIGIIVSAAEDKSIKVWRTRENLEKNNFDISAIPEEKSSKFLLIRDLLHYERILFCEKSNFNNCKFSNLSTKIILDGNFNSGDPNPPAPAKN